MNLPNAHSLEACREITRVNPTTKVIVFTAMKDPAVGQAFFEAGASAFVSKMAAEDLLRTIKRLFEVDTPRTGKRVRDFAIYAREAPYS